jgi:cell division protein FtsN
MLKAFLVTAAFMVAPVVGMAQATQPLNPVYRRAQAMVNDGNVTGGRALVDSMIAVAAPGSNEYAEGVYWRAVLAATASDAEMDYRRLVVDYPMSPRVDDALIRLAQLEMARGNYDGALRHLNRLVAEHPQSPSRARAGYWMARALFDKNDLQGGCIATSDALGRTSEDDAELRNQITYLNQRCAGVSLTPPAAAPVAANTQAQTTAPQSANPVVASPSRDTSGVAAAPVTAPPAAVIADSTKTVVVATPKEPVSQSVPAKSNPKPPAKPRDASPSMVEIPKNLPVASSSTSSEGSKVYSVQVAAYNVKSQADAMVAKLKKSGYEARVDGTAKPFRVRIGKYATQAQAAAVQRSLKAKQISGFVVQAEIQ